ncbi:MAG: hypothetical protein NXY59_02760 [Aigarchaeota archaeon]|nr:hypothetical protein [Candidatus Pelearchaeum maunauluense]
MKLKHWIAVFTFLIIGILGFLTAILLSPLLLDLIGVAMGITGILLSSLSAIYGATSAQVDTFRHEFREFRRDVVDELRTIRITLDEVLKVLRGGG